MPRWPTNALGRLQDAAMELFLERGYTATRVSDIATHAGLNERTFFRYFADKREVLFWGTDLLQAFAAETILAAPSDVLPLDAAFSALEAAATELQGRPAWSRSRQALIAAHPELKERELAKHAALAATIADALRKRGATDGTATLVAEAVLAVFKVGFDRWLAEPVPSDLPQHLRDALVELRAVTGDPTPRSTP